MARNKIKWKCIFIVQIILLNVFTKSLPILDTKLSSLTTTDTVFRNTDVPAFIESDEDLTEVTTEAIDDSSNATETIEDDFETTTQIDHLTTEISTEKIETNDVISIKNETQIAAARNVSSSELFRNLRPGQEVRQYTVELTPDGDMFSGRAVIDVILTFDTREDPIVFHTDGLNIQSVRAGIFTANNAVDVFFELDDGIIEIFPDIVASSYIIIIEYTGSLTNNLGRGLYRGYYDTNSYLAMNLNPTHARRVFPCMDQPTDVSITSLTFNNLDQFNHVAANSELEENSASTFRALPGPPHLWGFVAHNFVQINLPTAANVLFYARAFLNQESQASLAINHYFTELNEWTDKPYFEIQMNQDGRLHIMALPDVDRDWVALSTVGIWEPYVLMETGHSVQQRKTGLVKIAEALAKQWFGYVIYPENWRHEWVISGLATHAAYNVFNSFQTNAFGIEDETLLDVNTLFVTDIIQESLLQDAYTNANVLEPEEDLFEEEEIRDHLLGVMKYKAPALMRMWRLVLGGPENDFIQAAAQALLHGKALQTVSSLDFIDALNSVWMGNGNGNVDDIGEYIEPWITSAGYPLVHVGLRQGGVLITQEKFGFSSSQHVNFEIPITYTTSVNPNFDDVHPLMMMDNTLAINMILDEEDFVLFNIQGQGYYRVNYDSELWERIIEALSDPDRRAEIHPLNRATLVDDALNLARAGMLDYDIAFRIVLTMEHETEYAVWKAFVRNMDFLKKHLEAMVEDDEDLDPDIYLRMVRRTIISVENELGFYPEENLNEPVMHSLTRGLVMDHACRARYQPCIAAAVDWFYDPNNNEAVNPNIPQDIRPAVYCTMVKEGGEQAINALYQKLETEVSAYERVIILESLACSPDDGFINSFLQETIAQGGPYSTEEKVRIFKAVAASSTNNAFIAMNFLFTRANDIRNWYGGQEKFEELLHNLSPNIVSWISGDFQIFVFAQNNNLGDSQDTAERALGRVLEDMEWEVAHMQYVYEWIDENDAPTLTLSILALCASVFIAIFNR